MKKILLSLAVVTLTVPAFSSIQLSRQGNASVVSGVPSCRAKTFGQLPTPTKITPATKAAASSSDAGIISQPPAGKLVTMMGTSLSFYIYYDQVTQDESRGLAYDAVFTDDGYVYLKNPVSMLDWNTYIKGKVTEEGLKFDFPQTIYASSNEDGDFEFQADVLEYVEYEDPNNPFDYVATFVPAEKTRSITFYANEEGGYQMDGDYMLGITYNGNWQGYGEMQLSLQPFEAKVADVPADLSYDYSYVLADELNGWDHTVLRPVGIGKKDGNMYITGLSSGMPDAVITGKFDNDSNTLTIPSNQFLGKFDNRYIFMMVGAGYSYYDEYWEEEVISFDTVNEPLVLNFDPEKKLFTPVVPEGNEYSYLIFNFGNTTAFPFEYYTVDRIYSQGEITDFSPITPEVVAVTEIDFIDPDYSYSFEFNIFGENEVGQILNNTNLYYNIFVNGELCTFTSDEYPELALAGYSELTDIPAGLNVGSDIYASGDYHGVALKRKNVETIGVRSVYIDNGNRGESETVTVTNAGLPVGGDSVTSISATAEPTTEYFDINGRKVTVDGASGIIVKRTILGDGTAVTEKIVR